MTSSAFTMAETRPTIRPSSQLARGARKPAMNTPPMAGGRTKYSYMRLVIERGSLATATRSPPTTVMATGTHRAYVWVTSHGRDARSARRSTGWNAWRKAVPIEMRPAGLDIAGFERRAALRRGGRCRGGSRGASAPAVPSASAVAARWRRRASARSVLLARANGLSCPGLGRTPDSAVIGGSGVADIVADGLRMSGRQPPISGR